MKISNLTEENLAKFKALYPNNEQIQKVTLDEIKANTKGVKLDGSNVTFNSNASSATLDSKSTSCDIAIASVVVDVFLMVMGTVELRESMPHAVFEDVAHSVESEKSTIEEMAKIFSDSSASAKDKAKAALKLGTMIYKAGMFKAVFHAIINSLTWWEMLLYGVLGLAEIAAAFLTGGAAEIAAFVGELASTAILVDDADKVIKEC